ncbi:MULTISPECIES: methyl-accepting chemotaxis protein [unclassified Clostridium]|uniref:methyl-accepting chemotaxis protein n=1 Tax=unclassified Clostridium TaxID=2614128 RepID=UPI0025B9DC4E|nr:MULTISPECIES: methyl-accepting chemotaxis protein [unclassified Clostridium]
MGKIKMSLRTKLMSVYIISIAALIGIVLTLYNSSLKDSNDYQMLEMGKIIANNFTHDISNSSTDIQDIVEEFYEKNNEVVDIINIVDKNDKMIGHSIRERVGEDCSNVSLMNQIRSTKEILGERHYIEQAKKNLFIITFPHMNAEGEVEYVINVGIKIDNILQNSKELFIKQIIISLSILALIVLVCTFYLSKVTNSIKNVVEVSEEIIKGDFTLRFTKDYKIKEIETLNNALNKIMENVSSFIEEFKNNSIHFSETTKDLLENAKQITSKSENTNIKSKDILNSLENSSATIQEIYSSIEEIGTITETLNQKVLETSESANAIKEKTNENKRKSTKELQETESIYNEKKEKIKKLIKESEIVNDISIIVKELDNITNQINLLALNAQIEATHAGEYGKGFAVVANEIRKLADQTNQTLNNVEPITHEIKNTVSNLGNNANKILEFINNKITKDNELLEIVNEDYIQNSNEISEITSEIRHMSAEVNQSIEQISIAINDFAQKTEEVYANTEQMNGDIKEINNMNEHIQKGIENRVTRMNNMNDEMDKFIL